MPIRTQHVINNPMWFITFTCYNWLPLFEITNSYDLLYNWYSLIPEKYSIYTCGFVIMPNHVHCLLYLNDQTVNLNSVIANGKRFISYEIIRRLKDRNYSVLLDQLSAGCTEKDRSKGQLHRVFEPSFDAKTIYNQAFFDQKLDYIHHNPVNGKWNLSIEYTDYLHSSAAFYLDGKQHPDLVITDYRDLIW
jgi:REP element-mobilizing transposase RayT